MTASQKTLPRHSASNRSLLIAGTRPHAECWVFRPLQARLFTRIRQSRLKHHGNPQDWDAGTAGYGCIEQFVPADSAFVNYI